MKNQLNRRAFCQTSIAAGMTAIPLMNYATAAEPVLQQSTSMYLIGPQPGYTPMVGTLLSTMTMMREWVLGEVRGLTQEQLDFQFDDESNTIGAMLLHLAATERYYQLNTFDGIDWGEWSDDIKSEWDHAMNLGDESRRRIVGHEIDFYIDKLNEVRENTKKGFAERDDEWLAASETFFGNQPTNNHCKWFHVCEHESNHNGQIKFLKKRLPS